MSRKKIEHLTFRVDNSASTPKEFNILGAEYNGFDLNKNPMGGVSVGVPQSSAAQAQADNLNTVFTITELKFRVSNVEQLSEPLYIKTKMATGELTEIPITPSDYTSPDNAQDKLVASGPVAIKINGNVGFRGTLLPKSKLTIFISLEYDYRPSNFIEQVRSFFSTPAHRLMRLVPEIR